MTGEHVVAPALLEAVGEDTSLTPEEKETTLRLGKRDDLAAVYLAVVEAVGDTPPALLDTPDGAGGEQ